jgi:isobutyryl-CoA mutase
VRHYHEQTELQAEALRRVWHLEQALRTIGESALEGDRETLVARLKAEAELAREAVDAASVKLMEGWPAIRDAYSQDDLVYAVRGGEVRTPLFSESLCHSKIPKIALPSIDEPGMLFRWLRRENLPGYFPYTAGVFPLKRTGEDPPACLPAKATRHAPTAALKCCPPKARPNGLSTAFDSVTLYGFDPDLRPDIYGKIGNAGVSICTLDDVKVLYGGFDLCAPNTSVSMTINGPAPIMLAMFLNTAIDQQVERFEPNRDARPTQEYAAISAPSPFHSARHGAGRYPQGGSGTEHLHLFHRFRFEDDGRHSAVLRGEPVRNFYSVSISGYHIAEAGANPISQLAFTLANGFTYLEYYLSRGMPIDSFGPNLSFFFSNGMDPEYTVIGRVARRIWAVACGICMAAARVPRCSNTTFRPRGAPCTARTSSSTTSAPPASLCAIYDNCQSLHTNAFDEAITTPSEESVRRALAIQLIINREWGLAKNENPLQGSFIVDQLTDLVEEAVLAEFDRITARGGVLGAMETGYQRSKIQEESIYYETLKHTGDLPIIGVNTFRDPHADQDIGADDFSIELARSTPQEKESQLQRLAKFQQRNADHASQALEKLQKVALAGGNTFEALMETVRHCSLGQITGHCTRWAASTVAICTLNR